MTEKTDRWLMMKEILADVLETPPGERASLLAQRCRGDSELQSEIEALLQDQDATYVFDKLLPLLPGDDFPFSAYSDPAATGADSDALIGSTIGRYRLERCIGEGGMGRVYEAVQDDRELVRKVAVKLLRAGMNSTLLIQRFRQERQVLAIQTHPNIARLYDFGATQDGMPYFVMEYVDGMPIDRYCDEHALTVIQRLLLFKKVCAAVSSAHSHLIIHRDLKPSNILVTVEGEPKLLDFGIAKPLDHELTGNEALHTVAAARFLTPEYASPEQILGKPVSTASDIYSLGVLLYYLLTARLPFQFQTGSPLEWEKIAVTAQLEKPSTVVGRDDGKRENAARCRRTSPEKLRKLLSGEIDNIVAMAMKKEPERRYGTVQQFREDINHYLDGLPIFAQADTLGYRMRKFIGRHRMAVVGTAVVVLSLVAAAIGISLEARKAKAEAETARTVIEFLKEMVASPNPFEGDGGRDVTVAESLDRAVETIKPRFGDKPGIAAEIHTTIGVTYLGLGLYEAGENQLRQALDLLEKNHDPPHPQLAAGLKELGLANHYLGNYEKADALLSRSVAMFDELGKDGSSHANALNEYAMVAQEQGKYEEAGHYFSRARDMFRRLHGPEHKDVVTLTGNLALNAHYLGELDKSESLYRETLHILQKIYGRDHPDIAIVFGNLAQVLVERQDYDGAESLLNQSLALKRKFLGEDHTAVGLDYHNLAGVCYMEKEYERAAAYLDEALAVYSRAYPEGHTRIGQSFLMKGNIRNAQKRYDAAEDPIRRALAIFKNNLPRSHELIALGEGSLGESLTGLGRYQEAEEFLLASYSSFQDKPAERQKLRTTVRNLVKLYETWPREQEAARFREMLASDELTSP